MSPQKSHLFNLTLASLLLYFSRKATLHPLLCYFVHVCLQKLHLPLGPFVLGWFPKTSSIWYSTRSVIVHLTLHQFTYEIRMIITATQLHTHTYIRWYTYIYIYIYMYMCVCVSSLLKNVIMREDHHHLHHIHFLSAKCQLMNLYSKHPFVFLLPTFESNA